MKEMADASCRETNRLVMGSVRDRLPFDGHECALICRNPKSNYLTRAIGCLPHLGLARTYSLQSNTAKARAAYQGFLTLWKDADPNIPVLKEAKAEYAKCNKLKTIARTLFAIRAMFSPAR
jgi:hypothetical protein